MNRSQLANALAERLDVKPRQGREILDSFVDVVTETVTSGEVVTISGFAKFARRDQGPRMVRNPATGEMIKKGATRKVRITPLKAFKDTVMSGKVAKKATAKKAPAKKAPAKKATVAKSTAKKAPAKKAAAKKAPAKKATAKKTAAKRR